VNGKGLSMHLQMLGIAVWLCLASAVARAQDLPEQIRIVVPLSAGSTLDARARVIAEALGRQLKRRILVENRPGAGGTIGSAAVARARPDGATLLFNNNSHVISPWLYANPGYDPLADFAPVHRPYDTGLVLVAHPKLGVSSVAELVTLARDARRRPTYASSGIGGVPHFGMELFNRSAGVSLVHVPYRGDAQAQTDLLGGQSPVMMSGYVAALPHVKAGRLRALAVTSPRRTPIFPNVPTLAEAGYPDYALDAWGGFFAPARTAPAVVDKLHRAFAAAVASAMVQEHFAATGAETVNDTPAAFAAFLRKESQRYGSLVRELRLKAE
jgi:tripartite-type tricarboxylate transporter receptor subunit TctC